MLPATTGATHDTTTCPLPGTPTTDVGAGDCGTTGADGVDGAPSPTSVFASTRNTYAVPFVRPVTVADVAADTSSANVTHELPLLLLYCTT